MAHKRLDNADIMDFVPRMMKEDKAAIAFSKALNPLIQGMAKQSEVLSIWNQIDILPENILDELAWEFNEVWGKSIFLSLALPTTYTLEGNKINYEDVN